MVKVFPDEKCIIRLAGSVLVDYNEATRDSKGLFNEKNYKAMFDTAVSEKLSDIAGKQKRGLTAGKKK